jgi:hypothetical protein
MDETFPIPGSFSLFFPLFFPLFFSLIFSLIFSLVVLMPFPIGLFFAHLCPLEVVGG